MAVKALVSGPDFLAVVQFMCHQLLLCSMQPPEVLKFLKRGDNSTIRITLPPRNALPKATVRVLRLFSFENKQIHIPGNSWIKFPRQQSEFGGRASSSTGKGSGSSPRRTPGQPEGSRLSVSAVPGFWHRPAPGVPGHPAGLPPSPGAPRQLPVLQRGLLPWKHHSTSFICSLLDVTKPPIIFLNSIYTRRRRNVTGFMPTCFTVREFTRGGRKEKAEITTGRRGKISRCGDCMKRNSGEDDLINCRVK